MAQGNPFFPMQRNSSFTITNFATQYPYVKPEDVEHFLDGLRKAGLPDDPEPVN